MLGPLIVNFDHATRDGVVEGSLALSDLDDLEVRIGDAIGVMDSGAGPYEAEVIGVDGDTIRVRAPTLTAPQSNPGLVNADGLEMWADSPSARTGLTDLVRELLIDTPGVTDLTVRTGRGVDLPGWDALADGGPGTPYVPAGRSAWEMGAGRDPRRKAEEDYRKRTRDPLGVDPAVTAFVFVTPRRWAGKDEWSRSKRAERVWRDVRVLDADDLEGWLRSRHPVHVRFSERLGLRPREIKSLRLWWDRWSEPTTPPFPSDLLLAGRDSQADKLRGELSGTASGIGIKAGSRDEAIAFTAAVLHSLDDPDHLSRSFVVASATAWDDSVSKPGRSVLVPDFEGADMAAAVRAGHQVVVPMGVDDPGQAIELPRLGRSEARAAFEAMGIEPDKADRYAVRARRSLTSLRRALSVNPRVARPGWEQGPDGDILAALVLVGSWSDNREADHQIVSEIVNRDYESVERLLCRWENSEDPPFRRSGNSWRLSNPEDAWERLSRQIITQDLKRWGKAVLEVLGTRDPVLDLAPLSRFMAPLYGLEQQWSDDLRRGLAQGIALLAVLGLPRLIAGLTGPGHAGRLVQDLLDRAGNDYLGKLWQQLSDVLPLLAEAAPEVFLEAVCRDSGGDQPLLAKMFTDHNVFASSPHVGLLWGLERLCWSSEHLPAAMDALVQLAQIDPGGRCAARPLESARLALWPLAPQTSGSLERRMYTLDGLLDRFPNTGKQLLLELVPSKVSHWTDSNKPRFRDWLCSESFTPRDSTQAVEEIASRVTAMEILRVRGLDSVASKLEKIVDRYGRLFEWDLVEEAQRQETDQQRRQAVIELFSLGRTRTMSDFAGRVRRPELVGQVAADSLHDVVTDELLSLMTGEYTNRKMALGWVKRMYELNGTAWVGSILEDNPHLVAEARADILLVFPTAQAIWSLLEKEEKVVRESYWRRIGQVHVSAEAFDSYMDALLDHDRVRLALRVSWTRSAAQPAELIENGTIERVLAAVSRFDGHRFSGVIYYIGQLMDLMSPESETVAFLEGHLRFPLQGVGRSPMGLYGRLRKDPVLFADLVCQVDRSIRERPQLDTSRAQQLPQGSAWTILQGWRVVPGYDDASGRIHSTSLRSWVHKARRRLQQRGMSYLGDSFIGELLSGSPTGRDGAWPAEPVRELLEEIESRPMEEGLMAGAINARGTTTHGILEGGGQERALRDRYRAMAAKTDTRWLRTSRVLRQLADHYHGQALYRDEIAQGRADSD